jgi:hypothetical protein
MMKKAISPFLILLFCFITACNKDDLPKPSQTRAGSFGCKVNGRVWIPDGNPGPMGLPPVGLYYYRDYSLLITAYKKRRGEVDQTIQIYLNNVNKPGTYSLNYDGRNYPGGIYHDNYGLYSSRNPDSYYVTNAKVGGTVTITRADTVARIISGTFSFNAVDKDNNQIKITNSRFDVKS